MEVRCGHWQRSMGDGEGVEGRVSEVGWNMGVLDVPSGSFFKRKLSQVITVGLLGEEERESKREQ